MATPTGHTQPQKLATYFCVSAKPVAAVSLLVGSVAIMGFSAPPTSGAGSQDEVRLPVFGTSPLRTQSYSSVEEHFVIPTALATIRRVTGFTWEELASHFGVTRRAVHDWASGKQLSRKNEDAVRAFLERVRELDTGSPAATRALLAASATGQVAQPLFQPERHPARPLSQRAREKIATAGGPLFGGEQSPATTAAPKLIKRVPITVKKS